MAFQGKTRVRTKVFTETSTVQLMKKSNCLIHIKVHVDYCEDEWMPPH